MTPRPEGEPRRDGTCGQFAPFLSVQVDPIKWGAVVLGAVTGIAAAAVPTLALLLLGNDTESPQVQILLVLAGFVGQVVAGFVAGATAGARHAAHGALAAAGGFLALAAIALASQIDPGATGLSFGVVVALVIGSAGGVLAGVTRRNT